MSKPVVSLPLYLVSMGEKNTTDSVFDGFVCGRLQAVAVENLIANKSRLT
jgi:hypothetical protein